MHRHRLLLHGVDADADAVPDTAGLDDHRLGFSFSTSKQHVRHHDDGLKSIALSAASGCDVSFTAGNPDREVEQAGNGIGGDAGAVVGDGDAALVLRGADREADVGRSANLLGDINGVVA